MDVDEGEFEEWAEEEDSEVDEGGGPDDLSSFDLESMEEEAIDAVREYSLSLSRELVLGIGSFSYIFFLQKLNLSS